MHICMRYLQLQSHWQTPFSELMRQFRVTCKISQKKCIFSPTALFFRTLLLHCGRCSRDAVLADLRTLLGDICDATSKESSRLSPSLGVRLTRYFFWRKIDMCDHQCIPGNMVIVHIFDFQTYYAWKIVLCACNAYTNAPNTIFFVCTNSEPHIMWQNEISGENGYFSLENYIFGVIELQTSRYLPKISIMVQVTRSNFA